MEDDIKVSVVMITYNHEKYIRHALESVMMQKTTFSYEILIGDDCSNDKTVQIAEDVLKNYTGKAILLARKKNIGMNANSYDLCCQAKGKYIAELEGDDFWIDKYKLQKQFDFLESHPNCSAYAHKMAVVNEREHPLGRSLPAIEGLNRYFGKQDVIKYEAALLHPNSLMYSNIYKENRGQCMNHSDENFGGHKILIFLLATLGDIYISDAVMGSHRFVSRVCASNAKSLVVQNPVFWRYGRLDLYLYMKRYFSDSYDFTNFISSEWCSLAKYLYDNEVPGKKEIMLKYLKKLSIKEIVKIPYFLVKEIYL